MKWSILVGAIAGLAALVFVVGMIIPVKHTAARMAHYRESPEVIWQTITDYEKYPQWRSNVTRVEAMPSRNELPAHREWDTHGNSLPMETVRADAPRLLITRIADPKLPFEHPELLFLHV